MKSNPNPLALVVSFIGWSAFPRRRQWFFQTWGPQSAGHLRGVRLFGLTVNFWRFQ